MVSIITNAIAQGFTAKQILSYIMGRYPQHANKINAALAAGYTADKILKHFSDGGKSDTSNSDEYLTDHEKTRRNTERQTRKTQIAALGTAAALGGLGVGLLSQSAKSIIPEVLPALQEQLALPNEQNIIKQLPGPDQIESVIQPNAPVNPPNAPINPLINPKNTPVNQPSKNILPSNQVLQNLGHLERVKNMLNAGNPPEKIGALINSLLTPEQRKNFGAALKEGSIKPLNEMIKDIANETSATRPQATTQQHPIVPAQEPILQQPISPQSAMELPTEQEMQKNVLKPSAISPIIPSTIPPNPMQPIEPVQQQQQPQEIPELPEEQKIQKGEQVLTVDGIGSVDSLSGDNALINVNGKRQQVKSDDVARPSRDIVDIYEELTQAIPEKLRSSVINWAGYDPNVNELAFRPHNGSLYVYKDIPPEFAEKLQNSMFKAKTTGENFYGAWAEGQDSRFAGLSQLIQDLQKAYGGKGKEYIRKYESVHDFLAYPEAAKKEKHKKEMQSKKEQKERNRAEQERIKEQNKENAKKRKKKPSSD